MPPVGPQGSRGGLITAVVVFTIGFVTSTIFAIYYGVALSKSELDKKVAVDRANAVTSGAPDPRVSRLQDWMKNNPNLKDRTLLGGAMQQGQDQASLIGAPTPADALKEARATLDDVGKRTGSSAPTSLLDAVRKLEAFADQKDKEAVAMSAKADAATAEATSQIAHTQEINKQAQDRIAEATKQKELWLYAAQNSSDGYIKKVAAMIKDNEVLSTEFNAKLKDMQNGKDRSDRTIVEKDKQIGTLVQKLSSLRYRVDEPIVRQSDGRVVSVASTDIVYINLGKRDQIIPGMSFEVYSKQEGIPHLGDGMSNESLPIGLGSIEVQTVYADSSLCRVTHHETGQHFQQGDLIANLVYDRNTKFNFFVYGRFDLAQSGIPSDLDKDKVLGLVKHWGGKPMDKINIDTDFVIMGSEPKVNTYTADQLTDPIYVRQKADEEGALKTYNDIRDQATKLSIPIMNQNRFLYFCGYYDTAQR